MKIVGPDRLVFGVDAIGDCFAYLRDFGLNPVDASDNGGFFEALDGTGIEIRARSDTSLPPPMQSSTMLRKQVYGVVDSASLEAIAHELARDRRVQQLADGTIETEDDQGFTLGFQVTKRRALTLPAERINAPGAPTQRGVNELGVRPDMPAVPRTLSHVVLFTPNTQQAENFYVKRLGFRVTDRLGGAGPFLRPQANDDHHTLFLIQTPPYMKGCEHLAFHVGGPTELMLAGSRFVEKGYQSFWGPGRHNFGSNWFWYFNSPLGCHVEFDCDMDKHDDNWLPRDVPFGPQAAQAFLLEYREKWAPGAGPPKAQASTDP